MNRVYKCQGNSCVLNKCKIDSKTKLYEKDCQFFPDKVQTEKSSIMFMQGITSVSMSIISSYSIFIIKGHVIMFIKYLCRWPDGLNILI